MARLSRLSPYNIEDPIIRVKLYDAIRKGDITWDEWEVSLDELDKPELISYRYYGTDQAKLIVAVAAGLDDLRGNIKAGIVISLPSVTWIRQKIKELQTLEIRLESINTESKTSEVSVVASSDDVVNTVIASIAREGGALVYNHATQKMITHSRLPLPGELLAEVETHKVALFDAIGGGDALIGVTDSGETSDPDIVIDYDFNALANQLEEASALVLPSDEISLESLNRHKYAFDAKFNVVAEALRQMQN